MNMTERFKKYLEAEFRKISPTKAAMEYRKDTLVKLEELAQDYRIKGMTDDEAIYNACISSLGDLGGLWAMYGVYYWSCNANSAGIAYSMCIRKDSETNIYTIGFMGSQTMARPVRCIKE